MHANHPVFQWKDFDEKFTYLKKHADRTIAERIVKTIEEKIAVDPTRATKRHKGKSYKPIRILRIGDYRVFFIYCRECRDEGQLERWIARCGDICIDDHNDAIVLIDVEHRGNSYTGNVLT
jgi:mRNA-degrading endonuclease RelE of RelBE toxin-antitoxin system